MTATIQAPTDAPMLVIPPCATCDHPAVRAFIEVVSAAESKSPAWHILELSRELARLGYKLDLIAPADDAEIPPAPWCWYLKDGRIVSGLPIGTTLTIAPEASSPIGEPLPIVGNDATFERETGRTRQGSTRSVDPSSASRSARPNPENTPLESSLQRTLLQ